MKGIIRKLNTFKFNHYPPLKSWNPLMRSNWNRGNNFLTCLVLAMPCIFVKLTGLSFFVLVFVLLRLGAHITWHLKFIFFMSSIWNLSEAMGWVFRTLFTIDGIQFSSLDRISWKGFAILNLATWYVGVVLCFSFSLKWLTG